jgi:hypothetical protein
MACYGLDAGWGWRVLFSRIALALSLVESSCASISWTAGCEPQCMSLRRASGARRIEGAGACRDVSCVSLSAVVGFDVRFLDPRSLILFVCFVLWPSIFRITHEWSSAGCRDDFHAILRNSLVDSLAADVSARGTPQARQGFMQGLRAGVLACGRSTLLGIKTVY